MIDRSHWREKAACRGKPTVIFFPVSVLGVNANIIRWDEAKAICDTCNVVKQCLNMVLVFEDTDDKWGMYGGKTPQERRILRYEQKKLMR